MSDHNPSREVDVFGNQLCGCGDRYPCPTVILTDLIAELRGCPIVPVIAQDLEPLQSMADRAEARLKGLNDE
jgi:hypothetical protein